MQFLAAFTQKELGQFSGLAKKCKASKVSSGELLGFVLRDWIEYTQFVKSQAGTKTNPLAPNIGYLLTHFSEAVGYLLNKKKAKEEKNEIKKNAKATYEAAMANPVVLPEKEVPATLDDPVMQALFAKHKAEVAAKKAAEEADYSEKLKKFNALLAEKKLSGQKKEE